MSQGSKSKRVSVGGILVVALAVVAGSAGAFLATHAGAATGNHEASQTYNVTAKLAAKAGATGHGALTGRLTRASALRGSLSWKLTFSGVGAPVTAAQLRLRSTGRVLAKFCGPCATGAHKTLALRAVPLAAIVGNKASVVLTTKIHATGALTGTLKSKVASSGGGGGTVVVTPALVAAGKAASAKYNCEGCHTINGTKSTGPTWKGLAGSKVRQTDGTTVTATDAYLIKIITDPSNAKVVGYDSGVMSEVIAPGEVSDSQARAIVAYIKTLK
jgi:cytochrome c1